MEAFVGVVEDRFDPLKLGRCRVRVFGVHTEDKTILPTADLPWAMPLQAINNAATSGIGSSPTGIVHGSWVVGFYLDGEDRQQFMMQGTISAIQASSLVGKKAPVAVKAEVRTKEKKIVPVAPVPVIPNTKVDIPPKVSSTTGITPTESVRQPSGWILGQTSKFYESGTKGCGAINPYNGALRGVLDGAAYGTYQFASYLPTILPNGKSRPSAIGSPLMTYIKKSKFADKFAGLVPATPAWDAMWTECATKHTKEFTEDQHHFTKAKYYDVMIGNLKRNGLDLTSFGAAVQDLVWSTSVQLGQYRTSVFLNPLKGKSQLDDITIVQLVMDYKIANVNTLFGRSDDVTRKGVLNRWIKEKKDLLKLAANYNSSVPTPVSKAEAEVKYPPKPPTPIPVDPDTPEVKPTIWTMITDVVKGVVDTVTDFLSKNDPDNVKVLIETSTGYSDPDGVYPLKEYDNLPDTNKLATGTFEGTVAEMKSHDRALGLPLPDGQTFDQPQNTFNAKYPYNKVFQSESGHVIEIDDTPGSGRINVYHASGTFLEIDDVGNFVKRVVGSDYSITDTNGYLYVEGKYNISVGGACNIMVASDANIEVTGNTNILCGNDIIAEAAGRIQISAGEAIDLRSKNIYIEADEELHVTAGTKVNIQSDAVMNVKTGSDLNVQSDAVMNLKASSNVNVQSEASINGKAANDLNLESGAAMNAKSGANLNMMATMDANINATMNAKIFGTVTANVKSAGIAAVDGTSLMLQSGMALVAGTADSAIAAGVAEEANYGEAGIVEGRINYEEMEYDDEFPISKADTISMLIETPEDAANGGTEIVHKALIEQGVTTPVQVAVVPVATSIDLYPDAVIAKPLAPTYKKTESSDSKHLKTLTNIPDSYRLSPNFTLGMLSSKAPAQPDKVRAQDGRTEGEIVANLQALAVNILEPIKKAYPNMIVTSCFRDLSHNTAKTVSQHCKGQAVDMQFPGMKFSDYHLIAQEIKKLVKFDQLLLEYKNFGSKAPWIHISYVDEVKNRDVVMTFYNNRKHSDGLTKLA